MFSRFKSSVAGICTLAMGGLMSTTASAQVDVASDPDVMVLELQILQDEIIEGNLEAYKLLQPSLLVVGRRFLSLDLKTWEQARNARAAVAFMLSGGSGSVFQEIASKGAAFNIDANLFAGAMAYSQGNRVAAKNLLQKVDPRQLPTGLAGQVALAQGILIAEDDPARASFYFDLARLFMPGTLVEESALRRQVPIIAGNGDHSKFQRLARRYLFQYTDSVFADEFRKEVASILIGPDYLTAENEWDKIYQIVTEFDLRSQTTVLQDVARASLIGGNTEFAGLASDMLLENAYSGDLQIQLAKLYRGGAEASGENWQAGLESALSVSAKDLPIKEQIMQSAIIDVANSIRAWPAPRMAAASEFSAYVPAYDLEEKMKDPHALDGFKSAMENADKVIGEAEF